MTKMRQIEQTNKFELVLNLEALGIAVPRDAGDCRVLRAQSKGSCMFQLNAAPCQMAASGRRSEMDTDRSGAVRLRIRRHPNPMMK